MPTRNASAMWRGDLRQGSGHMSFGSGAYEGPYSFASRFEEGTGTNPEELIGAAHAGCFSMAFAARLAKAGFIPENISTKASVILENTESGFKITKVALETEANVPDIDTDTFMQLAEDAKANCPVSQALAGTKITLRASLDN